MLKIHKIKNQDTGQVDTIIVIDARTEIDDLEHLPRRVDKAIVFGARYPSPDVLAALEARDIPIDYSYVLSEVTNSSFRSFFPMRNPGARKALSFGDAPTSPESSEDAALGKKRSRSELDGAAAGQVPRVENQPLAKKGRFQKGRFQ